MLMDKKLIKYTGLFIILYGLVSLYLGMSDLWTSALYFAQQFGQSVFEHQVNFPLGVRIVGEVQPTSFESLLVAVALFLAQILFALQAKSAKKGSTERIIYTVAYVVCAIADTYTDIMFRAGEGSVSVQLVLVSVFLYNLGSEWGITLAGAYIWDKVSSYSGDWLGNAKQNVKNLNQPQGKPKQQDKQHVKQHGGRQQIPAQQFASQNDVVPTVIQRQPRTAKMNGRPINGNDAVELARQVH